MRRSGPSVPGKEPERPSPRRKTPQAQSSRKTARASRRLSSSGSRRVCASSFFFTSLAGSQGLWATFCCHPDSPETGPHLRHPQAKGANPGEWKPAGWDGMSIAFGPECPPPSSNRTTDRHKPPAHAATPGFAAWDRGMGRSKPPTREPSPDFLNLLAICSGSWKPTVSGNRASRPTIVYGPPCRRRSPLLPIRPLP